MKVGVIIIFHNNEKQIDKNNFINHINSTENLELCLVNNQSTDETLELLNRIKESSIDSIAVVDIKKKVSLEAAKRAGVRYMTNSHNLRHLGFIDASSILSDDIKFSEIIKEIVKNKDDLVDYNMNKLRQQSTKTSLFKSVFSVIDYLHQLKKVDCHNNLNKIIKT